MHKSPQKTLIIEDEGHLQAKSGSFPFKFLLTTDFHFQTDLLLGRSCDFKYLKISPDGTITVKEGFAWDGVTPKKNFLHVTWGWFDGMSIIHENTGEFRPYTYYGSMLHSVLYYYKRSAPITRKEADLVLLEALQLTDFRWTRFYYRLSRVLGGIFKGWNYQPE